MSLFKNIVNKNLLLELTDSQERDQDIKDAINNVLRVRIGYDDEQGGKGKNLRYILPVAFGVNKNGNKVIRAYQPSGSSKRGVPNWKLFRMDRIYSWDNGKKTFKDYKDTLINLGLNTHGDKGMTKLFAITPFADEDVMVANNTNPIGAKPVTHDDVQPTAKLQNPTLNKDRENFKPNLQPAQVKTVDKDATDAYFKNKVEAPATEPVTQQELTPQQTVQPSEPVQTNTLTGPETEPVTQNDLRNTELAKSYRDMMDRMDNVNKDNEEEKEEGER